MSLRNYFWKQSYTGWDTTFFRGMFEIASMFDGLPMLIVNLAFRAGSSKQGNARRASVDWNCDAASHLKQKTY